MIGNTTWYGWIKAIATGSIAAIGFPLCSLAVGPAGYVDASTIEAFAKDGSQWPSSAGDYSEQRFSLLRQINRDTVARLGFAWEADLNADRGVEATPIVVGGVMYVSSTWSQVFAFDAKTGKELWHYRPNIRASVVQDVCCDIVNRGVAVWKGRVYVGTLDGHLVALDARTGQVDWTIDTISDHKWPYSVTGPILAVKDKVIVGNSGGDRGVRAYVTAYDATTGAQVWRFYVVPKGPKGPFENEDQEKAAQSWPNDPIWTDVGGGSVWGAVSYDPKLNLLYFGTGNAGPWKRLRLEDTTDDLYVTSIVALNADTGRVAWHYQEVPDDRWDYDADSPITLADIQIGGRSRQVVMQAPKDGFFYILDRKTGELLSAQQYGAVTWASRVDMKTGRPVKTDNADFRAQDRLIYPNGNGAHDWFPMAYSPHTGLVYIPAQDKPTLYSVVPGHSYVGHLVASPEELARLTHGLPRIENGGFLRAWDPVNRRVRWQVSLGNAWNGGTLATAGDLVFQATQDGYFTAYDAGSGKPLKRIFTGSSAIAGPMTYSIGNTQYVAIAAGFGGAPSWQMGQSAAARYYTNSGRMVVFKLDGGSVPTPKKLDMPRGPPVVDQSGLPTPDQKLMARGAQLYGRCTQCHGQLGSTPNLPNLERVHTLGLDAFRSILLGALEPGGMPSFAGKLSDDDIKALYEYVSRGEHNKPTSIKWY